MGKMGRNTGSRKSVKSSHGGGTTFSRNSQAAPSTGNSIGGYKMTNPIVGKQGGKAKLGNPSSSMVSTGRFGGGR
jgi:hypothetical protein